MAGGLERRVFAGMAADVGDQDPPRRRHLGNPSRRRPPTEEVGAEEGQFTESCLRGV